MVNASTARLHLGERIRLPMLEAVEEFALSAVPRGPLRRQLLEGVDRGSAHFKVELKLTRNLPGQVLESLFLL